MNSVDICDLFNGEDQRKPIVPLKSNFIDTLVGTQHGDYVVVSKYRPKSGQSVQPTRKSVVYSSDSPHGRTNRASILRDISRSNSSRNICSSSSWYKDKRLCEIRSFYRQPNTLSSKSTSPRRSLSPIRTKSLSTQSTELLNLDDLLQTKKIDVSSRAVNTEPNFYSMDKWHGANWQVHLPRMYLPRGEVRDKNASVVIGSKMIKSRWRHADEMKGNSVRKPN